VITFPEAICLVSPIEIIGVGVGLGVTIGVRVGGRQLSPVHTVAWMVGIVTGVQLEKINGKKLPRKIIFSRVSFITNNYTRIRGTGIKTRKKRISATTPITFLLLSSGVI
jgi:hypothetical protein